MFAQCLDIPYVKINIKYQLSMVPGRIHIIQPI
jgi:hypothetical protein